MDRLYRDGGRHVHGDPRHSDRRELAARNPGRARHPVRPVELGADRLFDGRDRRDPADRLAHPDAVDIRRVRHLRRRLYRSERRLRRRDRVLDADPGAGGSGLLRRCPDPARLFGDFCDVRRAGAEPRDPGRGALRDARPDPRPGGRRVCHRPVLMALAVSGQCAAGDRRGCAGRLGRRCRPSRPAPFRIGRPVGLAAPRDAAGQSRIAAEGGAAARLVERPDAFARGLLRDFSGVGSFGARCVTRRR